MSLILSELTLVKPVPRDQAALVVHPTELPITYVVVATVSRYTETKAVSLISVLMNLTTVVVSLFLLTQKLFLLDQTNLGSKSRVVIVKGLAICKQLGHRWLELWLLNLLLFLDHYIWLDHHRHLYNIVFEILLTARGLTLPTLVVLLNASDAHKYALTVLVRWIDLLQRVIVSRSRAELVIICGWIHVWSFVLADLRTLLSASSQVAVTAAATTAE